MHSAKYSQPGVQTLSFSRPANICQHTKPVAMTQQLRCRIAANVHKHAQTGMLKMLMCFCNERITGCVTNTQQRKGCGLFTFGYPARKENLPPPEAPLPLHPPFPPSLLVPEKYPSLSSPCQTKCLTDNSPVLHNNRLLAHMNSSLI